MKITVVRSGGFAGITLPAKVLETNDDSMMESLRRLAEAQTPEIQKMFDGTNVDISIEENGVTRLIKVNEPGASEDVQKIIDHVLNHGK